MLKNTDRYKQEDEIHFSNSEYKQKKAPKRQYKDITVFLSVFLIGLLIILGFAKILSPNVDVEIADNEEYSELEGDDLINGTIDERLKHLQQEDENRIGDDKMFSPELDEKVVIPTQAKKTEGEIELQKQQEKEKEKLQEEKTQQEQKPNKPEEKTVAVQNAPAPVQNTTYRVVVGQYASEKQAEVAKSIIQDAGAGVSPIVKNIGGVYTLQVGVFNDRQKAQNLTNNLLKSNFPARITE